MKQFKKLHIATSRPIGEKCKEWILGQGIELFPIEECDIFISVMYDKIIPESFIASRPCYNFHPGVLPWYRGAGAYSWAIINGEFETGVTLHKIDKDIDHGDVLEIRRFPIDRCDTAETLFAKAEITIFEMFKSFLQNGLESSMVQTIQQDGRIYYRKDLEKARDITHFVRAFTFTGKENAFFINRKGEKIELKYE